MSRYDHAFGGAKGAAAKAHAAMVREHGQAEGERMFYATVNARKGRTVLTGRRKSTHAR